MKLYKISGSLDRETLSGFDASYSTEYIYRVSASGMTVELCKEKLGSKLSRTYDIDDIEESISNSDQTFIADAEDKIIGFAAVGFENWNSRAVLRGIYVLPEYKGHGLGTTLLKEAISYANSVKARCLWLETQNVNFPAISFYLRSGFRFCGFDNSLYDPEKVLGDEIALYFCLDLN